MQLFVITYCCKDTNDFGPLSKKAYKSLDDAIFVVLEDIDKKEGFEDTPDKVSKEEIENELRENMYSESSYFRYFIDVLTFDL